MTFFLGGKKRKKNLHLILYYGWFLQNLRKDFIRTNMHTTVIKIQAAASFGENFHC